MRVISCAVAMTRTQQATGSSSECKFHGGGALRCACRSDGRSSRDNARDHQFLHAQPLQPICGDHLPCGAALAVMLGRVQSVDSECLRYAAVFVTQLIPVLLSLTSQHEHRAPPIHPAQTLNQLDCTVHGTCIDALTGCINGADLAPTNSETN